ncbi:MAG: ABC transporter ATP-binding protein [Bifidobacteriaceae bacterium]|nr:ABC transporter ATP-binding protein [Bifidobacteriaceae bacterium]
MDGVCVSLGGHRIIGGASLEVTAGEKVAIVGKTGSGKSTLLACVMGLLRPKQGVVFWNGTNLANLSARQLAKLRRTALGVVFQDGELMPGLTAVENVALPAVLDGVLWQTAESWARELLASVGVPTENRAANTLSGGERQRTALARALINRPSLLIADEPTGSLDADTRGEVSDLLFSRGADNDRALLVVTHDLMIAGKADKIYNMSEGKLVPFAGSVL